MCVRNVSAKQRASFVVAKLHAAYGLADNCLNQTLNRFAKTLKCVQ